MKFSDLIRL